MAQLQEAIFAALTGGALGAVGAARLLAKGFTIVGAPMVAKFLADIGAASASAAAAMAPYLVCAGGGILIGLAVYGTYVYFFRRNEGEAQMNGSRDVQNHAAPKAVIAHNGSTVSTNNYLTHINVGNTQGAYNEARREARMVTTPEQLAEAFERAAMLDNLVRVYRSELMQLCMPATGAPAQAPSPRDTTQQ